MLKVAIVGRPNVGKSSLFNRIVGARKAIVEASSGTTRDRIHADVKWKGKGFTLIDMAGFEDKTKDEMSELMLKQLLKGVKDADVILFMTDGTAGVMPQDRELALMLRKASKEIYLVVNKIDRESDEPRTLDFFELGLGEPYAISAMHDRGIDKLCNDLAAGIKMDSRFCGNDSKTGGNDTTRHPEEGEADRRIWRADSSAPSGPQNDSEAVKVAIVGRPNVGKSSYLNAILKEERAIVHPTAGTTRDAIDVDFNYKDRDYILIDTAGIRHNPKVNRAADFYGGVRSEEAIRRSDVAVMLIDGYEGLMKDDARIIDLCRREAKPLVIAVNKWDLVKEIEMSKYTDRLKEEMSDIRDLPVVFMSAKTGRNIDQSLDVIWSVYERSRMVASPDKLKETLKLLNNIEQIRGQQIKFKYLVQEGSNPPKFIIGAERPKFLSDNLRRFVENYIRKAYDLVGVPVLVRYR